MKEFIHEYKGFGIHPSKCRVYIMKSGGKDYIGFENIEGTSVTNATEQIASEIVKKEGLDPKNCLFFEWYPEYNSEVCIINYHWDGLEASSPTWKYFCELEYNPFFLEE